VLTEQRILSYPNGEALWGEWDSAGK
jgi:hypothetical protein